MDSSSEGVSAAAIGAVETASTGDDEDEPTTKKLCLKQSYASDTGEPSSNIYITPKLEKRLSRVLCCTVCLDLPISSIFQVLLSSLLP